MPNDWLDTPEGRECVERAWGAYSDPGDDATSEEELAAMRAVLRAANVRPNVVTEEMIARGAQALLDVARNEAEAPRIPLSDSLGEHSYRQSASTALRAALGADDA